MDNSTLNFLYGTWKDPYFSNGTNTTSSNIYSGIEPNITYRKHHFSHTSTVALVMESLSYYVTPFIVAIGVFGNFLSILMLLKSKLNNFSSSHYLAAICVANTLYLVVTWVKWFKHFGIAIKNQPGMCQVITFVEEGSIFLSNWYLVAFLVDRYISMCWRTEGVRLCTKIRARVVVIGLAVLATVVYINLSITRGTLSLHGMLICSFLPFYIHNIRMLVMIVEVLNIFFPYTCLLLLSVLIMRRLYTLHKRDVFSDENPPLLLKQTTFMYIICIYVLHTPYEIFHAAYIIHGMVNYSARPLWHYLTDSILLHLFYLSLTVHFFIFIGTYPLFRNYLKQHGIMLCKRMTTCKCKKSSENTDSQDNDTKSDRVDIEFQGVAQNDESAI